MKSLIARLVMGLLLAVITLGFLFWVPAYSTNRLRPLPAHAQIIYNNQNPDWFLSFFPLLGQTGVEGSADWSQSILPESRIFQSLMQRPLAVAVVADSRRNDWIAVSELGGARAVALRWALLFHRPEGVEPVRSYAAWPIWKLEHPSLPVWARVRFSVTDGLLICSISTDSHDIYKWIDVVDGRSASMADGKD